MIRIRYSPGEYEIAGSPVELRGVARRLKELARGGVDEVIVCDDAFDPKPYSSLVPLLRLTKKEEKDRVSMSENKLTFTGSNEGLLRFASFFDMPDDAEDGFHTHHEYFPGNEYVASDSLPVVISVERNPPNKAPEPTTPSVTPAADAPVAPATTAAHL